MEYLSTPIPSNESFLAQWNAWVHSKVSRHFKRDKGRVLDTAQNVRVRLLSKDFIGRWFYKHLRHEMVDRLQAERMLGGAQITFIGQVRNLDVPNAACKSPKCAKRHARGLGCPRSCPNSLWSVSDLLSYARFDYKRYYYSAQDHTIDTSRVLRLLGYPPDAYDSLASLYRQNRLKPAELTEHECSGTKNCPGCEHGKSLLRRRNISLASRWSDPSVRDQVRRLRWNDSQLVPFLRNWRGENTVAATPLYIMRSPGPNGRVPDVNAGLLKYAEKIIRNEVVNDFKRISRTDDVSRMVFNDGKSPEFSNDETMAYEGEDEDDRLNQVFRDTNSLSDYKGFEQRSDVSALIDRVGLTSEEKNAVLAVELMDMTVRQYSDVTGVPVPRVHRVRASALRKLRCDSIPVDNVVEAACGRHGCSPKDLSGSDMVGPCVRARTEAFSELHELGMSVEMIADRFECSESRVVAAINRMTLREMRQSAT